MSRCFFAFTLKLKFLSHYQTNSTNNPRNRDDIDTRVVFFFLLAMVFFLGRELTRFQMPLPHDDKKKQRKIHYCTSAG